MCCPTQWGFLSFLDCPLILTRARQFQFVFCSVSRDDVGTGLLGRYLDYMDTIMTPDPTPIGKREAFLQEVAEELAANGYSVWPMFKVAGREVDMVIERSGRTIGIDLIGPVGDIGDAVEHNEARLLGRAGLILFPLTLSAWLFNRANCLTAIGQFLESAPGDTSITEPPTYQNTFCAS